MLLDAEAAAGRAGAIGVVEGEQPRLDFGNGEAGDRAGEFLREQNPLRAALVVDFRGLLVGLSSLRPLAAGASAYSITARPSASFSAVSKLSASRWPMSGRTTMRSTTTSMSCGNFLSSVGASASSWNLPSILTRWNPFLRYSASSLLVFALAAAHDRRQQIKPRALRQRQHAIDHLRDDLAFDRQAGGRRIGHADARPQQPHVVVDLGDGADRRARVFRGGLLLDRNRRRQPVDLVDIGLLHHLQELPRIGRQRLDVAALAFGIDGVERERGFAGARQAREHHQLVARNFDVDVFQIVLARAANGDRTQADWRMLASAFKISSMSAFPGARKTQEGRVAGKRSDASDRARNIGRTGVNFQCRVKTINGLFRCARKSRRNGSSGQQGAIKKPARGRLF